MRWRLRHAIRLSLFASLLAAAPEAQTWPEPGEGFEWVRVGDRPVTARYLAFDSRGQLWGSVPSPYGGIVRLNQPADSESVWVTSGLVRSTDSVLPLGRGDTAIATDGFARRTLDGGKTWSDRLGRLNASVLREVPTALGLPADLRAGHLLAGGTKALGRSTDRGASWLDVPGTPPGSRIEDVLVLPAGAPHAGRLLVSTVIYGDFVGVADSTGRLALEESADSRAHPTRTLERMRAMPSGRLIGTGYFSGGGQNVSFVSDDGGETWRVTASLPEPQKGIPGTAELAVIGPRTALAIGGRGIVYRTEDDGETWTVVGRAPVLALNASVQSVAMDPEGRVYLGIVRSGTDVDWVVRTVEPVVVAQEPTPSEAGLGARLTVAPNPASGAARIALSLDAPEAATLRVFDARGREVWAEASGARGQHAWEVSTAGWAAGVYVVRAEVGGEVVTAQMTVAR